MTNDTLLSDLGVAFDDVHLAARKLSTLSWMMRSVADGSVVPPRDSITITDAVDLAMEILDATTAEMDKIATLAREDIHDRLHPKVSR
jgi:hypothetical protein